MAAITYRAQHWKVGIKDAVGKLVYENRLLAGHTTSPTVVDWDKNGIADLLVGAEDGYFYYMKNLRAGAGVR